MDHNMQAVSTPLKNRESNLQDTDLNLSSDFLKNAEMFTKSSNNSNPKLTRAQKDGLIRNLRLELNTRANILRSKYQLSAKSIRRRMEMRLNRIPKRLYEVKIGDLAKSKRPLTKGKKQ